MAKHLDIHQLSARKFVYHCKNAFGWSDLSNDVIMDVGCGEQGWCGKLVLELFPDVRAIIGIDKQPIVAHNFLPRTSTKMDCRVADIEERETLKSYEGQMTKVISTHTFHQLIDKEKAFRNVYHLLKPGGEAAVLFVVKSEMYEWLTEMLKIPKWKGVYQRDYVADLYKRGAGSDYFKEMVENIGFRILECTEEKIVIPYPSDQVCKEALHEMCGSFFQIPPETLEEFKEDSLRILCEVSARDPEGKLCYRSTEVCLLLVRPAETSDSGTKNLEF